LSFNGSYTKVGVIFQTFMELALKFFQMSLWHRKYKI